MQDHYETLQVHPRADVETIQAAYARLRERYDPARLEGSAEELQELARRRRDEIERAYLVLSDPERRRRYDEELAARQAALAEERAATGEEALDYRPLPPARGQERPPGFNAQPTLRSGSAPRRSGRATRRGALPVWLAPTLIVAVAVFAIVLVTLVTTVYSLPPGAAPVGGPQQAGTGALVSAAAPTPDMMAIINQFEGQIVAARQVARRAPENPNAWIELGNALYDSVVVVRERLASGDQNLQNIYIERLPRWLEAADAYRKATELAPTDPVARADLAASLCFYGKDTNDQNYVREGLAEAERALRDDPEAARALLSKGLCLAFSDPPQVAQALEQWQQLIVLPGAEPGLVMQARQLVAEYSR
ncbi:MAG: DnaJ domain-containing protein [Chloroflexaceae bacterium]|nr:DnaJ domain-containing protein [Chloroflexaceae bacterium]